MKKEILFYSFVAIKFKKKYHHHFTNICFSIIIIFLTLVFLSCPPFSQTASLNFQNASSHNATKNVQCNQLGKEHDGVSEQFNTHFKVDITAEKELTDHTNEG